MKEEFGTGDLIAGRYRVKYLAGRGSQARIYCCSDTRLGTLEVALKVFKSNARNSKDVRTEIMAATRVDHDNVVRLYDIIYTDTVLALVMEWCPGKNLLEFISTAKEPVSIPRALNLLRQIASALDAIHKKNILHRDLKPENIIILPDDRVKVSDFGVSELQSNFVIESDKTRIGTPYFLPLEYLEGNAFDQRSDIYAFGLCAYELLTGQAAFKNLDMDTLLEEKRCKKLKSPRSVRKDCPEELDGLCIACASEEPDIRPQNASSIVELLRSLFVTFDFQPPANPKESARKSEQQNTLHKLMSFLTEPTPLLHLSLLQLVLIVAVLFAFITTLKHYNVLPFG